MNIIKASIEDKKEIYRITHEVAVMLKDSAGEVIKVDEYVITSEPRKNTDEVVNCVFIKSGGKVFAGSSPSFVNDFMEIVDIFGSEFTAVRVNAVKSAKNRTFLKCALVE